MRLHGTDVSVELRSNLLFLEQDSDFQRFRLKSSCSRFQDKPLRYSRELSVAGSNILSRIVTTDFFCVAIGEGGCKQKPIPIFGGISGEYLS